MNTFMTRRKFLNGTAMVAGGALTSGAVGNQFGLPIVGTANAAGTAQRIDAHMHFWQIKDPFHGFPNAKFKSLYKDIMPADYAPLMKQSNLDGVVVVEAAFNTAETEWMLELAEKEDIIKAVVGWVKLEDAASVADVNRFASNPYFAGMRAKFNKHDLDWPLDDALTPAINSFIKHDLSMDIQVRNQHWDVAAKFIEKYPDLRVVINHAAKPVTKNGIDGEFGYDQWAPHVEKWASNPNVNIKMSGFFAGTSPKGYSLDTFEPYMKHLWNSFGAERILFGSNWPVLRLAPGGETDVWEGMVATFLDKVNASQDERNALMGGTASRVYKIS